MPRVGRHSTSSSSSGSVRRRILALLACLPAVALVMACEESLAPSAELTPPDSLQVVVLGPTSLQVSWSPAPGAVANVLERRDNLEGEFRSLREFTVDPNNVPARLSWVDRDLTPGTFYGYRVRSVSALGDISGPTTVAGAQTAGEPGIRVRTRTSGGSPFLDPDGYRVRVTGPDSAEVGVGLSDEVDLSPLAAGPYEVELLGIAGNCFVEGANPLPVEVTEQGAQTTAEAAFDLVCRDPSRGDIRVEIALQGDTVPFTTLQAVVSAPAQGQDSAFVTSRSAPVGAGNLNGVVAFTYADLLARSYQVEVLDVPEICSFRGGSALQDAEVQALSTDTVSFTLTCVSGGGAPAGDANVFGRWVDAGGAPITSAAVGDAVTLQICSSAFQPAYEFDYGWPGQLTPAGEPVALDASGSGVHPDCVGSDSPPPDVFLPGASDNNPAERFIQVVYLELGAASGKIGLAEIPFTVAGTGRLQVSVNDVLIGSGSAQDGAETVDPVMNITPLCVETTGCEDGGGGGGGSGVSVATGGPYTAAPNQEITFDASASTGKDGAEVVGYEWDFGDGSDIRSTSQPRTFHTYGTVDTFTVTLTVTDEDGNTGTATTEARITEAAPPSGTNLLLRWVDEAGIPVTAVGVGEVVRAQLCTTENLVAFQSTVAYPGGLTLQSLGDLDSSAPTGVHPECQGAPDVLDGFIQASSGLASPVTFSLSSAAAAPSAVTSVGVAELTFLTATAGSWDLALSSLVGQRFGGQSVGFALDADTLAVLDNARPLVDAGGPYAAAPGEAVSFDATATTDPDGDSLEVWIWDFGDGSPVDSLSGPAPSHVYPDTGSYTAVLRVRDAVGLVGLDSTLVTISGSVSDPALWENEWAADTVESTVPVALTVWTNPGRQFDGILGRVSWPGAILRYDSITPGTAFTALVTDSLLAPGELELFGRASARIEGADLTRRRLATVYFTAVGAGRVETATSGVQLFNGPPVDASGLPIQEDTVEIATGNLPPVADAGGDYTARVGQGVTFSAALSEDSDGSIVDFSWSFGDGNTGTGPAPVHAYTASGTFTARLTVTDDQGATDTDEATVDVIANQAPVVDPNGPYNVVAGDTVTFSAVGSQDPDGSITGFIWDFGDGTTESVSSIETTHVYTQVGQFVVTLIGTDDFGAEGTANTSVNVSEPASFSLKHAWEALPVATAPGMAPPRFENRSNGAAPGQRVALRMTTRPRDGELRLVSGEIGYDPGVLRLDSIEGGAFFDQSFSWIKVGADRFSIAAQSSGAPSDADAAIEVGTAFFTVIGLEGASSTTATEGLNLERSGGAAIGLDGLPVLESTLFVYETGENIPPTAEANGPYTGTVGVPLELNGAGIDPDGFIARYDWRFGDGNVMGDGGPRPVHTYARAGSFTVRLTVTDQLGATATDVATVTIRDSVAAGSPPSADAGSDVSGTEGSPVSFDGSGSSDPDGDIETYTWSFGDGSSPVSGSSPTASHTYATDGTYTVTLTVTDAQGFSDTDQLTATIAASGGGGGGGGGGTSPPVADAGGPYTGTAGSAVSFDASGSSDPDGDIDSYAWDFDADGTVDKTVSTATTTFTYATDGSYQAVLTVTDAGGRTDVDTAAVTVSAGGGGGGGGGGGPDGNFLGRWVVVSSSLHAAGTSLSSGDAVANGDVVEWQICVLGYNADAAQAESTWDTDILSLNGSATLLQSTDDNAHTDCSGDLDELNEFFAVGPVSRTIENRAAAIDLTNPGVPYTAGLVRYPFTVVGSSGETIEITRSNLVLSRHGGASDPPGTVTVDITDQIVPDYHTLVVN